VDSLNQVVLQNVGVFVGLLGVLAVVGLVIGGMGLRRVSVMSRRFAWATGAETDVATLPALLSTVESNVRRIGQMEAVVREHTAEMQTHFKHAGLVRYDAFDGVAGQQSYSLCLLDDHRNGVLVSNLVGSNFNRGYAVEIQGGVATRKLGEEEERAIVAATEKVTTASSSREEVLVPS